MLLSYNSEQLIADHLHGSWSSLALDNTSCPVFSHSSSQKLNGVAVWYKDTFPFPHFCVVLLRQEDPLLFSPSSPALPQVLLLGIVPFGGGK